METFGELLRNLRETKGWTLRELASKMNIDTSLMSKYERNERAFQVSMLPEISDIFNYPLEELEIEYIKSDIKLRYSYIENYSGKLNKAIARFKEENSIENIIKHGENKMVEFKSSLRFCLKNKKAEKHIEFSTIKNIAAFLNSNGGCILIGVEDNGNIIGLDNTDFLTFKEQNKVDAFLKHFDNLISKYFGNDYNSYIEVEIKKIKTQLVAKIEVKSNIDKPTIIRNSEDDKDEFYIRRNASAIKLSMEEFFKYCKVKW
jgi:transcriptional regulator with XRE-family HTH domain